MPAASIRKLAQERTASSVSTMESEVKLCAATVEGLAFLLWRHLEHFLLYVYMMIRKCQFVNSYFLSACENTGNIRKDAVIGPIFYQ